MGKLAQQFCALPISVAGTDVRRSIRYVHPADGPGWEGSGTRYRNPVPGCGRDFLHSSCWEQILSSAVTV